jgi:hypothetical protein
MDTSELPMQNPFTLWNQMQYLQAMMSILGNNNQHSFLEANTIFSVSPVLRPKLKGNSKKTNARFRMPKSISKQCNRSLVLQNN